MDRWRNFLDSLDTNGGHILVLAIALGIVMSLHCPAAEKYQAEIVGAFLLALRGTGRTQ